MRMNPFPILVISLFAALFAGCAQRLNDYPLSSYNRPVTAKNKTPTKDATFQKVEAKEMDAKCEQLSQTGWTNLGSSIFTDIQNYPPWMAENLARNNGGDIVLESGELVGYTDAIGQEQIGSTSGRVATINNYTTGTVQGYNGYNPYYNSSSNFRGTTTGTVYIPGETIYRNYHYKAPTYRHRIVVFSKDTPNRTKP